MAIKALAIRYGAWRYKLDPVLEVFFLARFGLLMSVVASVLIAWPPQAIDAVRVLAEDARQSWFQIICFWLVALGLCLFLWGSVRVMFRLRLPPPEKRTPLILLVSKHLPCVLAVLPLLAIVIACARANIAAEVRQTSFVLWGFAIVSAVAVLLLYVVLSASEPWLQRNRESPLAYRIRCCRRQAAGGLRRR